MARDRPHVDAGHDRARVGAGAEGRPREAGVGGDDHRRPRSRPSARAQAWTRQRMPLPLISARLPSALKSAMPTSAPWPPLGMSASWPTSRPSAPMPRRRSHTCRRTTPRSPRPGGEPLVVEQTRKSLPRPWCLVSLTDASAAQRLLEQVDGGVRGRRRISTQRMRGSRRNQRSWRTANWRVRVMASGDRLVERGLHRRGGRAAPGSRAPARRCATGRPAGRASARTSARKPAASCAGKRSSIRRARTVARPAQADLDDTAVGG